jgi:ABC-2 type transport system permease protein
MTRMGRSSFRIRALIKKEFRQVVRDKRSLAVLLFTPLFLLIMFGYAVSLDVRRIGLAVVNENPSAESRRLIARIRQAEQFDLKYVLTDSREIDRLLDDERIKAALVIPLDFTYRLLRGETAVVQVILDGSNSTGAATALGYLQALVFHTNRRLRLAQGAGPESAGRGQALVDYRPRVWFNPELASPRFLVPGLIAFILVITAVVSTALSVVREKERGTMEQLIVSPLSSLELFIGKTVPYLLISLAAAAAILLASRVLFAITVAGSLLLLLLLTLVFILACLSLGILISTAAESQQVAFMLGVIITILPTFILSGFVFPIRNMPEVIRALTYLLPARYYLTALRGIMLRGVGLKACWPQLGGLGLFTALTLALSVYRLKRGRR